MLIGFNIENFLSFGNKIDFSMIADTKRSDSVVSIRNFNILKTAVIYGANASGKSNVLKALYFISNTISNRKRVIQSIDKLEHKPFLLSTETSNAPTSFEVIFIIDNTKYTYGLSSDSTTIYKEYLYADQKGKKTILFERDKHSKDYVNKVKFKEGAPFFDALTSKIKLSQNRLFLWKCDEEGGEISKSILEWADRIGMIDGSRSDQYSGYTSHRTKRDEVFRKKISDFINKMDTGIKDISCTEEDVPPIPQVILDALQMPEEEKKDIQKMKNTIINTLHDVYNEKKEYHTHTFFDLNIHESFGTRKLFRTLGPIFDTLEKGKIILIDELEASLHPGITAVLIELFNSEYNKNNAQIIFTTHDVNLFKVFDRDQVWFTQKDKYGATELYSLLDIKGVRKNSNVEKEYMQGKYGATPYIDYSILEHYSKTDEKDA
ncbi:ATP/GTP-binding protein [Campylobacter sp. RM16188]|uniref:AAA family ATPase n=1 Tax=Campylobacter sp. RM16188 TaxID=1705725 RepID=UPI00155329D5|nr:ATP-binding protein [Campylobacter sp. RM16188]